MLDRVLTAGVGFSTALDPRTAGEQAARQALSGAALESAQAAIVLATAAHGRGLGELVAAAAETLGSPCMAGGSMHGAMGGSVEVEQQPAVTVAALGGIVEARSLLLEEIGGHEETAGYELARWVGEDTRSEDLLFLVTDAHAVSIPGLLDGLVRARADVATIGLGASALPAARPLVWSGSRAASGAVAALLVRLPRPARIAVTPSCRPLSKLLCVGRTRGNWVLGLDGRPALDVYREVAGGPLAEDLRRARRFLLVGLPPDGEGARPGEGGGGTPPDGLRGALASELLIRNVVGVDESRGAIALPEPLDEGARVRLVMRDPDWARSRLLESAEALASRDTALALFLGCRARGRDLFGVTGLEAGYLARALEPAPVAGAQGALQIGPAGSSRPFRLSYAGVLALLDR